MTQPTRCWRRRRTAPFLLLPLVVALTGCADLPLAGELGQVQALAATCPDKPVLTEVRKDASGSQDSAEIDAAALSVVRSEVDLVVACAAHWGRGHFVLVLFATNASQTATVVDESVTVEGATEIARLRRVVRNQVAEQLYSRIDQAYPATLAGLVRSGSDVVSQFAVAGEAASQLEQSTGAAWALNLVVITDGFATNPAALSKVATVEAGRALGERLRNDQPLTGLGAWRVSVLGVGRTAAIKQPPTARIDAVKAFWTAFLAGSAEQVQVATDLPRGTGVATSAPAASAGVGR